MTRYTTRRWHTDLPALATALADVEQRRVILARLLLAALGRAPWRAHPAFAASDDDRLE